MARDVQRFAQVLRDCQTCRRDSCAYCFGIHVGLAYGRERWGQEDELPQCLVQHVSCGRPGRMQGAHLPTHRPIVYSNAGKFAAPYQSAGCRGTSAFEDSAHVCEAWVSERDRACMRMIVRVPKNVYAK